MDLGLRLPLLGDLVGVCAGRVRVLLRASAVVTIGCVHMDTVVLLVSLCEPVR